MVESRLARLVGCVAAVASLAGAAPAQAPRTTPADADADRPLFLRTVEVEGRTIALQIASRSYTRPAPAAEAPEGEGETPASGGPTVWLVGVAHIADRSFYRSIQSLVDTCEVVLYESIKPWGTGGAGGDTLKERRESTRAAMGFVTSLIELYRAQELRYPADIDELDQFAADLDPRLKACFDVAALDAWERPLIYRRRPDTSGYEVVSLGADGRPGGDGNDGDLVLSDEQATGPLEWAGQDSLQRELASALELGFQLDALSYGRANWRCSDLALDQVDRALRDGGVDFAPLAGALAGTSLPARFLKFALRLLRVADAVLEGRLSDTLKVVMIDILGDEAIMEQSLDQLGPAFREVIVDRRNQVAIDDLAAIIEKEPEVESVAIIYGAAHLPDLAEQLAGQLGYQPDGERWLTAIEVDLANSAASIDELNRMRRMMRLLMKR